MPNNTARFYVAAEMLTFLIYFYAVLQLNNSESN